MDVEFVKIKNGLRYQHEFECDDWICKGSFGKVVKATKEGKSYAIKILPRSSEKEPKMGIYNRRELTLLKKLELSNRNVIKYFDCWYLKVADEERMCIQMEMCLINLGDFVYSNQMGGAKIIQTCDQDQPRFYQHVFPQIINGLDAIHSLHWIHRDIHPGNILVANPNPQQINDIQIKIADFGLARYLGKPYGWATELTVAPELEKLSDKVGNCLYRAPELWTDTYDFKVDIYSAGMVLYFISRIFKDPTQMYSELKELKANQLDLEKKLECHQEEKLINVIKALLQKAEVRPTAEQTMKLLWNSTQAKDLTDASINASGASKTDFFARKDGEGKLTRCRLIKRTLSALRDAVKSEIGVEPDRQDLEQVRTFNGEKRRINISCDEDVQAMFLSVEDGEKVEIVVKTKLGETQDKSNIELLKLKDALVL